MKLFRDYKFSIVLLCIIILSIAHIHVSLFVVENPANPVFWGMLLNQTPPYLVSETFAWLIGVTCQCVITSFLFLLSTKLLKGEIRNFFMNWKAWIISYLLSLVIFFFLYSLCNESIMFLNNNRLQDWYYSTYRYKDAFKICVFDIFSQFIFLACYVILCIYHYRTAEKDKETSTLI